jgi:type III pantothenate kinase
LLIAGANIEPILYFPKQFLKKINLYICQLETKTMLLAIDIGNTRIKCAVFEQHTIIQSFVFNKESADENFKKILILYPKITYGITSSVGKIEERVIKNLEKEITLERINHQTKVPFLNLYATPATLGIDRIVLAVGATLKFPDQNRLVIDAGTCITYDFVDSKNNYLGGAISPGVSLRLKSLHTFTAKLPLLDVAYPENFIGNSTQEAILSGVIHGVLHEINGFIDQYSDKYEDLTIILTGGDAIFLAKNIKNTIFANSNFLLESLNELFIYAKNQNE